MLVRAGNVGIASVLTLASLLVAPRGASAQASSSPAVGDFEFRKFRLYLWGAAYEFLARNLDCYRLILYKPLDAR